MLPITSTVFCFFTYHNIVPIDDHPCTGGLSIYQVRTLLLNQKRNIYRYNCISVKFSTHKIDDFSIGNLAIELFCFIKFVSFYFPFLSLSPCFSSMSHKEFSYYFTYSLGNELQKPRLLSMWTQTLWQISPFSLMASSYKELEWKTYIWM